MGLIESETGACKVNILHVIKMCTTLLMVADDDLGVLGMFLSFWRIESVKNIVKFHSKIKMRSILSLFYFGV